jgi:hypothetical protein
MDVTLSGKGGVSNVGLPFGASPDVFWQGIYAALRIDGVALKVESFVDAQTMYAYFNSHAFAVRPALGLMRRWQELFTHLVTDAGYQRVACQDEPHKIFLFQALLSTLLATAIHASRLRLLPPDYNYPYNLQASLPPGRRAASFGSLTCLTYEDRCIDPNQVNDISIPDNLHMWLEAHNV